MKILHGNKITGVIVKQISPNFLLFKSDYMVTFGDKVGNMFILKSRYEEQFFNIESNSQTVGGAMLRIDDYNGENEEYLEKNSTYVFIGNIKKII